MNFHWKRSDSWAIAGIVILLGLTLWYAVWLDGLA